MSDPPLAPTLHLSPYDNGNEQQNAIRHQMDGFNVEHVERELQKQSALQVSIVRDKICVLTRKCDRATDKLNRMKKGKAADELNNILENLDRGIENLESELRNLQETELQHRDKVIMMYQVTDEENICHRVNGGVIENEDLVLTKNTPDKNSPDDFPLHAALQDPRAPSGSIFVECSITPSTHTCRRCRQFVCTLCYSEKRHQDMIWRCSECFDNESLTNQQQICDGKYESDGEGYL